ncbi:MAG: hypothetical protein VR72_11545 [Clostridiaceae bacterium BRH_c20a]|nr:MAG: hypothetical protein VR72_11545 [Clostridiaceae bacterium BRH_c20a]
MTNRPVYYLWSFLLILFTVIGFLILYFRTTQGLIITNLNNIIGWGLWVSFYIFFIGLSMGCYLIFSLGYVLDFKKFKSLGPLALYSALICLITGFLFILIDIGHMGRFWTVFINRNTTSILSWELHLYVVYLLIIIIQLWFLLRKDILNHLYKSRKESFFTKILLQNRELSSFNWERDSTIIKNIGYIGIPLAIAVHGGTGAIFAVIKARSFWNTGLFPIVFLVSASVSGVALQIFLLTLFKRGKKNLIKSLYNVLLILILFDLVLFLSQFIVGIYSDLPGQTSILQILTTGSFSKLFWLGQIGVGIFIPLLIFFLDFNKYTLAYMVGALSSLIGVFVTRMNLVIPQLTIPVLNGLVEAYESARVTNVYIPSTIEWIFSFGILLFSTLIFLYGLYLLPIFSDAS